MNNLTITEREVRQGKNNAETDMRGDYPITHIVDGDCAVFRAGGPGHWYYNLGGNSRENYGPYATKREALQALRAVNKAALAEVA